MIYELENETKEEKERRKDFEELVKFVEDHGFEIDWELTDPVYESFYERQETDVFKVSATFPKTNTPQFEVYEVIGHSVYIMMMENYAERAEVESGLITKHDLFDKEAEMIAQKIENNYIISFDVIEDDDSLVIRGRKGGPIPKFEKREKKVEEKEKKPVKEKKEEKKEVKEIKKEKKPPKEKEIEREIEIKKGPRENVVWFFAKSGDFRLILTPGIIKNSLQRKEVVGKQKEVTIVGEIIKGETNKVEHRNIIISNAEYEWGINKYKEVTE